MRIIENLTQLLVTDEQRFTTHSTVDTSGIAAVIIVAVAAGCLDFLGMKIYVLYVIQYKSITSLSQPLTVARHQMLRIQYVTCHRQPYMAPR